MTALPVILTAGFVLVVVFKAGYSMGRLESTLETFTLQVQEINGTLGKITAMVQGIQTPSRIGLDGDGI